MSQEWGAGGPVALATLVVLVLLAVAVVGLAVALRRSHRRTAGALALAAADSETLRRRVDQLERRLVVPVEDRTEHLITLLGSVPAPTTEPTTDGATGDLESPTIPAPLFADLVLRESVVQAASLAAGVRRALAPEHRHRIRLAMRREVKRARKQRRLELRQAQRDLHQRQRAGIDLDGSAA